MKYSFIHILIFLFIANCATSSELNAQNKKRISVEEYVDTYKNIAIQEMDRTGIPASITLAQGIHESGAGNSKLALEAKNHFGIKCGGKWDGKTYYKWDDERSESCFRVYENAESSYLDHSNVLQKKRYAFLFDYNKTDYKKWAKGLRKAGYATDPRYPQKLIKTIEQYQLSQYDLAMPLIVLTDDVRDTSSSSIKDPKEIFIIPKETVRRLRNKPRSFLFKVYKKGFFRKNGATYIVAKKGETPLEVATRMDIPYKKFLRFNDLVDGDQLMDFQPCYIQPKRSKFKAKEKIKYIRVINDITMYEIAQYAGLKLEALYQRNLLKKGQEPKNGEIIVFDETVSVPPAIRKKHNDMLPPPAEEVVKKDPPVFPKKEDPTIIQPPLDINQPTYPNGVYQNDINTTINPDERYLNTEIVENDDPNWIENLEKEVDAQEDKLQQLPVFPRQDQNSTPTRELDETKSPSESRQLTEYDKPSNNGQSELLNSKTTRHVVQKGETLFSIGRKYKVSWKAIKIANHLQNDGIKEKQILKIPQR